METSRWMDGHDGKGSQSTPHMILSKECVILKNQVFHIKPADGSLCYSLRATDTLASSLCLTLGQCTEQTINSVLLCPYSCPH